MTDPAALREAELALQAAQLRSDVNELDRLLHDDEVHVGHDGAITDKAFDVENHRSGRVRIDEMETEHLSVRLTDGVGVTVLTTAVSGTVEDRAFKSRLRFTRTWAHGEHGWRVVCGHMTILGPGRP